MRILLVVDYNGCQEQPGYQPYADWRSQIAKRMTRYVPAQPVPL